MLSAALIAAGIVLLVMAVHPFTTYPASLWLLARRHGRPIAPGLPPTTAALCVCAFNEERVIRDKALNMLALQHAMPALELLVYVDAGNDRTAEILAEFSDRITVIAAGARTGKTAGMNALVRQTRAECVLFSDANVLFAADAVPHLLAPFGDPAVSVVCGHLRYGAAAAGNATAATGSLYWRLEERIKQLETATGSVMGADGSIFAMRRSAYQPAPADLIDDMFVSLSALCAGGRVVRAEHAVAFEEQVSHPAEEFRRKVRIACQAFNVHRTLRPRLRRLPALDRYKYVSHKLLRWFVAPLLAGGAVLLAAGLVIAGVWWLAAIGLVTGLCACLSGQVRSILSAFIATGVGVARSLRGDRFQTWNPPASSRSLIAATELPG